MDNQSGYEVAEKHSIPITHYYSIEYPGYSESGSIDPIFKTIGGLTKIRDCFNAHIADDENKIDNCLELRYDPDNHFSHPILGSVVDTHNLLIKVKTRRKKRRSANASNEQSQSFQVLGLITKTVRFRQMADFQYIPPLDNPYLPFVNTLQNSVFIDETVKDMITAINNVDPISIPPPVFSRVDASNTTYKYRQKPIDPHPAARITARKLKTSITYNPHLSNAIPIAPTQAIKDTINQAIHSETLDKLKKHFDERPIYLSRALFTGKFVRACLPMVAYYTSKGPFRGCWVRYGYDPSKHPESYIYQTLHLRNMNAKRKPRAPRQKRLNDVEDEKEAAENKYLGGTLQFVDMLEDGDIGKFIRSKFSATDSYDETNGWIKRQMVDQLRKMIKCQNPSSSDEDDDDDDDDEEEEYSQREPAEREEALDEEEEVVSELDQEAKKRVNSRVGELMRDLDMDDDDEDDFDFYDDGDE